MLLIFSFAERFHIITVIVYIAFHHDAYFSSNGLNDNAANHWSKIFPLQTLMLVDKNESLAHEDESQQTRGFPW